MERLGSICLRTRLLSQVKKIMKKKKREGERERGSMGTCSKDTSRLVAKRSCYTELSESAEQAKRRTEIAR